VPRLVLLNGPPASGKSTLARMFVDDHPLALDLDVDRLRDLVGGWRRHPERAGRLARAVVLAAARTHLGAGHDVVVPQFVGRLGFVEELADAATTAGAELVEMPPRGGGRPTGDEGGHRDGRPPGGDLRSAPDRPGLTRAARRDGASPRLRGA